MNSLDRAISWFAPTWGAHRARSRALIEVLERSYDVAKTGRRTSGWHRPSTSGNAEIAVGAARGRNAARELVRNNPHAKRAKRIYVANMIGTGIVPTPNTGNKRTDRKIADAFNAWCATADTMRILDFYGLQAQAAGAAYESGSVLARFHDESQVVPGTVPMSLQLLEPDFIDASRVGWADGSRTNVINQGIELDPNGRRVAFYLWAVHPGETALIARPLLSSRVPAEQIAHLFPAHVGRPGDINGMTEYAAVAQALRDLGDYNDAALLAKKIQSCIAAAVKRPAGPAQSPLAPTSTDGASPPNRLETFQPAMVQYLENGEDIEFFAPPAIADYTPFTNAQLHATAAGLGISFEDLTGDLSQVNYSSYRAGQLAFRRAIEMDQWLMFIPMFCLPIWRRFIDRLVIAGVLAQPNYGVSWSTPKFESVDPRIDADADKADARSGFVPLPDIIRRRGYEPDQVLAQTAAFLKAARDLGLVLDTDGSLTNLRGSAIPPDDTAAKPGTSAKPGDKGAKSDG